MHERDLENTQADSLARVMNLGASEEALWEPEELAAILRHQLRTEVHFDLSRLENSAAGLEQLKAAQQPPIRTFADLLAHPRPPVDLLELTKQFAKASQSTHDGTLPDEVATVLYLLSIVAALRCRHLMTSLGKQALLERIEWALSQRWLDDWTLRLLQEGRQTVESGEVSFNA